MTDLVFDDVDIPAVSYSGTNPYLGPVKQLAGTTKAKAFLYPVADAGVQWTFEKLKRDLGEAGNRADVTVKSIILDAATKAKLTLPSGKDRQIKVASNPADGTPVDVTGIIQLHVTFWTIDKIVQGKATSDEEE